MSIWHHPHNLTLVKKLQFNYKIHLCISWPIQAMSETCHGFFFFRLWVQCSVVLCYPQYFFPPPQHLVLLSLINCKFHHSCFRIKLKFLSSVKRYFLPRMFRHFLSASSDIFRHSIFWISIFLQNLPTCRQNFNQPFN